MTLDRAAQARSFGAAAAEYDRGRPSYPDAAVDWLLPPGARRVLDLGAGTGKLTRSLLERGLDVVAVEPLEGMRAQLAQVLPAVELRAGTAEEIPLPDAGLDAVLVAQAWHWVDPARALPEVARVLVDGGRLGLVWNLRDVSEPWVADLGRILGAGGAAQEDLDHIDLGSAFGDVEETQVRWTHHLTRAQLLDAVASRSYVITMAPPQRAALLTAVEHLLDTHPDLAGRSAADGCDVAVPYVTHCFRARKLGEAAARTSARSATSRDDERVRVTTWTFPGPGASTGPHVHELDYVVVPVTGGTFTVTGTTTDTGTGADGAVRVMAQVAGEPYSGAAGTAHDVTSTGEGQAVFVEVELKR